MDIKGKIFEGFKYVAQHLTNLIAFWPTSVSDVIVFKQLLAYLDLQFTTCRFEPFALYQTTPFTHRYLITLAYWRIPISFSAKQ